MAAKSQYGYVKYGYVKIRRLARCRLLKRYFLLYCLGHFGEFPHLNAVFEVFSTFMLVYDFIQLLLRTSPPDSGSPACPILTAPNFRFYVTYCSYFLHQFCFRHAHLQAMPCFFIASAR